MVRLQQRPDGRRISYAQNGEDIVLLRALGDSPTGTWVDVGANHPVNDSVTKNFSDLGWSGINVEPVASFHALLAEHRPGDVNILAAVSDHDGAMTFFRNDSNLDLSSFEPAIIDPYRARGDTIVEIDVVVRPLGAICAEHLTSSTIDFMKIDTEGHELPVLRSHDFERFPVRVLLAESTYDRLDPLVELLAARGMEFITFDGLNAWFIRTAEVDALRRRIAQPPSPVLDWYDPFVYATQLDAAAETIRRLEDEAAELRTAQPGPTLTRRIRGRLGRLRRRFA